MTWQRAPGYPYVAQILEHFLCVNIKMNPIIYLYASFIYTRVHIEINLCKKKMVVFARQWIVIEILREIKRMISFN